MFVITGGGSGIGRALAERLIARDEEVVIVGRNAEKLNQVAKGSSNIFRVVADVSSEDGREVLFHALRDYSELKGLVHNAATIDPIAPLGQINEHAWQSAMQTNVNAPLFITQKLMNKLSKGRVLHIGSGAAYNPIAGWTAYCTTKAALSMMTQCWQLEANLSVASVKPGVVNTELLSYACLHEAAMQDEKLAFFTKLREENRMLTPETVSYFLTWLLLDVKLKDYSSKEWDIYDISHHAQWLKAPHHVPQWDD